jgi:hypothetical protein
MSKKNLWIALAIYVVSAVLSYSAFSYTGVKNVGSSDKTSDNETVDQTLLSSLLDIDPNEAADQACPLNGAMYTMTERGAWEARRPLFVMIENSPDARPQSGLSKADVVFEAVAEGGVTRFGAVYYCAAQFQDVTLAPIRSARTYFLDWASGFNLPMYVHVGGANVAGPTDALGQIGDYGWEGENDINQFSVGYPTFVRDYNRVPGKELATEHTMVTTTEALWEVAADRGWTNMTPARTIGYKSYPEADWADEYSGWTFEENAGDKGTVTNFSYDFWTGYNQYSVEWTYDADKDAYLRKNGGEAAVDLNNDQQVAASTVVVLLTTEKGPINEKKHMIYGTTGKGKAYIFKHGQEAIEANWSKATREAELTFTDVRGKDIEFARGQVWISVLATGSEVTY